MTNRARPNWPDGADGGKSQRSPQGGSGKSQSTPTATPTSNGRTPPNANGNSSANGNGSAGSGQPRPSTPNGQPGQIRQPSPSAPVSQPGSPAAAKPSRPPQQPPVRPVVKQSPPLAPPSSPGSSAAQRPPLASPSTPGRPEPRFQAPAPGSGGQPVTPSYGQTGKASTGESFGDRVTAAKQAMLDKAGALKEAATSGSDTKARSFADGKTSRFGGKSDAKTPAAGTGVSTGVGSGAAVSARSAVGTSTSPSVKRSTRPQTRKARLRLSRIDPWSVMKTSFLLSIAFGIVVWVAVFIVWSAIGAAGVFDNINNTVSEVLGTPAAEPFRIENYINTGKVMGFTTLLACADVLIITALATLGSFLYNIAATLLGGLEVTLASED